MSWLAQPSEINAQRHNGWGIARQAPASRGIFLPLNEHLDKGKDRGLQKRPSNIAPIAQLDRALVYGTKGRKFESSWAR